MRKGRDGGLFSATALLLVLAAPACGSSAGGSSQFCSEWATAFCHKVWTCTPDPANNPFAGPSESECAKGYAMLCSQPPTADQTFDVNCSGGKQVNQAAKMSCLNKLNTVSCDDFNATTYDDDCDMVCTAGTSTGMGGAGGGGTGTGGTGGTSSGTCGTVQPCGGNIVGTWAFTGTCVNVAGMTDPNCPGYVVNSASANETGTLSFVAGGTYTANVSATVTVMDSTPATCIAPSTCADLAASYTIIGASATCSGSTVCACTIAIASNSAEAGTYTTSGTTVTTTPSGGTATSMAYCIQGTSMHLLHFNSAGQVTTEEILQRQ